MFQPYELFVIVRHVVSTHFGLEGGGEAKWNDVLSHLKVFGSAVQ